jgi:hypothetical protein
LSPSCRGRRTTCRRSGDAGTRCRWSCSLASRDPITGKRLYLSESSTDLAQAKKIRAKFRAQVAEQRSARTKATFRHAIGEWLKVHEIEDTTRQSYEMYLRLYIGPALGEMSVVLEQFYTDLRRRSRLCDRKPFVEHRENGLHECLVVKHRRPPGRMSASGVAP